jgi:hypothetical protein
MSRDVLQVHLHEFVPWFEEQLLRVYQCDLAPLLYGVQARVSEIKRALTKDHAQCVVDTLNALSLLAETLQTKAMTKHSQVQTKLLRFVEQVHMNATHGACS